MGAGEEDAVRGVSSVKRVGRWLRLRRTNKEQGESQALSATADKGGRRHIQKWRRPRSMEGVRGGWAGQGAGRFWGHDEQKPQLRESINSKSAAGQT